MYSRCPSPSTAQVVAAPDSSQLRIPTVPSLLRVGSASRLARRSASTRSQLPPARDSRQAALRLHGCGEVHAIAACAAVPPARLSARAADKHTLGLGSTNIGVSVSTTCWGLGELPNPFGCAGTHGPAAVRQVRDEQIEVVGRRAGGKTIKTGRSDSGR